MRNKVHEVITQLSFTPAEPPSQGNIVPEQEWVIGPVIKEHLLAQLLENGRKRAEVSSAARWGHLLHLGPLGPPSDPIQVG